MKAAHLLRRARRALALLPVLAGPAAHADVPPPAVVASAAATVVVDCTQALTQAQLNACAHEEFLAAQADLAATLRTLRRGHDRAQRAALARVQRAWLAYRTAACDYETLAAAGGSVRPMLQWQCAARLTRERSAALLQAGACVEGDVGCRPAAPAAPATPAR